MPDQPARRPYNAKGVRYVETVEGRIVTAVWVSDPTVDPAEALDKILHQDLPYEVEVIAEAVRHYRYEGADFSGWIVTAGNDFGDPIPNKRDALRHLRWAVEERFKPEGDA
jgi:hypothetical protein